MDINRGNLNELFKSFNMLFQKGLESAARDYEKYSMTVVSKSASQVYPFLEQFGGMREWIGDRQLNNVAAQKLEVLNRDFEDSVVVKRNDLEDDQYSLYGQLVQQLGQNAAALWGDLAIAALRGGDSSNWFDALAFFSDSRKYGDQPIDNLASAALSMSTYETARAAMMSYKGHSGRALKVTPNLLLVGPTNEGNAHDILKSSTKLVASKVANGDTEEVISGTISNPWAGTAEIVVDQDLGSEWFLIDSAKAVKPVVIQKRQEIKLTRMDADTDENVFSRKEYIYGADARGEAFLSFPHLVYGSFPS